MIQHKHIMETLSLYDICGDDYYVFANLENDGDISITVENDQGNEVYYEKSHIYAWDTLVAFAKMVLSQDEKIQKELETGQ